MPDVAPTTLFFALLGGILPANLWLWFWLKEEDKLHPEPRSLLMLSFLVGMLATAVALPIEKWVAFMVNGNTILEATPLLLTLWAAIEELLKFGAISLVALRTKYFHRPIDAIIFLITVAIGFAALENAMFLISPLNAGHMFQTIVLGNYRFIGATVLHIAASGTIGMGLALTFYSAKRLRYIAITLSVILAIALHTTFNFLIMESEGMYFYYVFLCLWIFILAILLACEKIKRMAPRSHVEYPFTGQIIKPHNILLS